MRFRRWRQFWTSIPARILGSHIDNAHDGITRLRSTAPTVTPHEIAKLERKRRQKPVDYDELPV